MEGFISVDCEGKQLHSVPQNIAVATIKLDLSGNKLKTLSSGVFSKNSELLYLSLSDNQLQFLPKGVLVRNSKLVKLYLSNNKLQSLPNRIFHNNRKLEILDLSNNKLQNLPRGILQNNSKLKILDLSKNELQNLSTGMFQNNGALRYLNLSNNHLKNLTSGVFSGLGWLFKLDLSNNQIKDLPPGVFHETSELFRLCLSNNYLENLTSGVFSGLRWLKKLDLSNNHLKDLPPGVLSDTIFLNRLDLSHNFLELLPADISKIHWLQELFLNNNNLKNLSSDFFPKTTWESHGQIKNLRLGGNQLKQLPRNIFKDLSNLEELDLSYNQLQKLSRGVLSDNTRLKELFLSNNKLRQLPSFNNLSQLTTLYMSNNSLSTLAHNQFQGLSNLADLAVYDNKIQYLPPRVFEGAKNLMSMSFHLNNIPSMSNVLFEDVAPSIRFMYFHYNEMRELPEGFFANMKELITATVDTNLMCCHLTKEDADCDFVHVDRFASCESMFRNPALKKCIWVIGILSLVGALFVIMWRLVFKEEMEEDKIQSIMLMHLAGSDGLMGVYLIIIGVMDAIWSGQYFLHDFEWRSSLSCQITGAIAVLSSEVSVMLITMLSADRVKNIVFPYRGRSLSCKVTHILCIVIWIIGSIIAFLPTAGLDYFGSPQRGHHFYGRSVVCLPLQLSSDKPAGWEYSVAIFVGLNFSLVVSVIVAYVMILYKSCASSWRMAQEGTKREKRAKSNEAQRKRETALAKRVFIIILTDCLCWLPIVVIGMRSLLEKSFSTPGDLTVWIAVFVLPINSAINPILYTVSTPQVQGILKSKFEQFWSFLMAKCGRTRNNEVQNQEEAESDDSDRSSEEEQSGLEQHAEPSGNHKEPADQQEGETEGQGEAKEDHKQPEQIEEGEPDGDFPETTGRESPRAPLATFDDDHDLDEPAENEKLIIDKDNSDDNFPAATGRESPRAPLATFDDDHDLDEFMDMLQETVL